MTHFVPDFVRPGDLDLETFDLEMDSRVAYAMDNVHIKLGISK